MYRHTTLFFLLYGLVTLGLLASPALGEDATAGYNHTAAINITSSGYLPEHYTLEFIGADELRGININESSWDLIENFTAKFGSNLSARWFGISVNDSHPVSAYVFRVLPDGSTISYIDYGTDGKDAAGKRARYWEETTLADETKCAINPSCTPLPREDPDSFFFYRPAPAQISSITAVHPFKPYGQLTYSAQLSWDNSHMSSAKQDVFFADNSVAIEPGDALNRDHRQEGYNEGWFAKGFDFTQYFQSEGPGHTYLPDVNLVDFYPQNGLASPVTIHTTIPPRPGEVAGIIGTLVAGILPRDKMSVGAGLDSYVDWEKEFSVFPLSDEGRNGTREGLGMKLYCDKALARNGNFWTIARNDISPDNSFRNLMDAEPENQTTFSTYFIAQWYDGRQISG